MTTEAQPTTSTAPSSSTEASVAPAAAPQTPAGAPAAAAAAAPVADPTKPKQPTDSEKWAKISKAEQRAREATEAAKKERAAADQAKAEVEATRKQLADREALFARAKAGDWTAREQMLSELGVTYDEFTKRKLAGGKPDPNAELKEKLAQLEQRLAKADEEREKAAAERKTQEEQAQRVRLTETFVGVVKTGGEKYELLAQEIAEDRAHVDEVIATLAKARPDLTFEQAADLYEQHLLDKTKKRLTLKKVQALLASTGTAGEAPKPSTSTAPQAKSEGDESANGSRTLTNADAAERASDGSERVVLVGPYARRQAERDRTRRAVAVVGGAKKS